VEVLAASDGVVISATRDEERVLAHFHDLARQLYEDYRVPTSRAKSGVRRSVVARLGVQVDGSRGIISLGADKAGRLVSMTAWFLKQRVITRHALQVIAGHWSHAVQLRRECSGLLGPLWAEIGGCSWRCRRRCMTAAVREALAELMVHLPLLVLDMRLAPDGVVTVSDASEYAGGVCRSSRLTLRGQVDLLRDLGRCEARGRDRLGLLALQDDI
jgi:hypothetical protein